MKIHSEIIPLSLDLAVLRNPDPYEGQLIQSAIGVMETCAPYIGQMCIEYLDDQWVWQPYSRLTHYFDSLEQAQHYDHEHYNDPEVGDGVEWLKHLIAEEKK